MSDAPRIPRVSIGMPVFNGERYLESTLGTVLNQSYEDFVLYISDNASTDRTEELCRQFASQDGRIRYLRNIENVGAAGNYEKCFVPAKSEYFRWQNADDPIEPTLIETCLNALEQNPDAVLAYGKAHFIDENGQLLREHVDTFDLHQDSPVDRFITCLRELGWQNLLYGLMRREVLARTARMQAFRAADMNLVVELTLYGKFIQLPEYLFNRRMHPECSSWDNSDEKRQTSFWAPGQRRLNMQNWRSSIEYFTAVSRAAISQADKQLICKWLFRRMYWYKSTLAAECVDYVRCNVLRVS